MENLFEKLNTPFEYCAYKYDKDNDNIYIKGQAVAERLNEVLGVGYWKYSPVPDSIELFDTGRTNKYKEKILNINVLVEFSFYNKDLKEWITFTDAGSQDLNKKMGKGDGTKSAITDALKKCASRIGVASDLYKGMITQRSGTVILPASYKEYYESKGWKGVFEGEKITAPSGGTGGTTKTLSEKQIARLYAIGLSKGFSRSKIDKSVKKDYGVTEPKLLTKQQYDELVERLEKAENQAS